MLLMLLSSMFLDGWPSFAAASGDTWHYHYAAASQNRPHKVCHMMVTQVPFEAAGISKGGGD